MIKLYRRFLNRQIVKIIQAAMIHDNYDKGHYLCNTIDRTSNSWWRKAAIARISTLINGHITLYCYIRHTLTFAGWSYHEYRAYTHLDWADQKAIHIKFWNLAIDTLLNSDADGPLKFFPEQLGLSKTPVDQPATKIYDGPFGSYKAGSAGAVLNALCEQEGRSCGTVGNYIIGNGKIYANHSSKKVVATYEWNDDDVVFTWNAA